MAEYLSPAVYIEEIASGNKPIQGASTSTGAFVGSGTLTSKEWHERLSRGPVTDNSLVNE